MKCLQGISKNIDRPLLGQVVKTYRPQWFSRDKKVQIRLLTAPVQRIPKADAYIISGYLPDHVNLEKPIIEGIPSVDVQELNHGDVLLLLPDGKINIIYEIEAHHNTIFATNRCNLQCIMCPQPPKADPDDILQNNLALIRLMNPKTTRTLAITGGEPTLLGDGLFRLIQACKEHLPQTSLIILTNGKKFNDLEFAKTLALIKHPDLVIAVPLYSDNDTIHDKIVGVQGSFYETLKGLHNLALLYQRVELRTVIHALNYKRLPRFAEFVFQNLPFAMHVALMGMETTGHARKNVDQLWIDPYDYSSQLERAVQYFHRANMNVSIYNHQLCIMSENLWPFSRKSISEWKNVYIVKCSECVEKNACGGFFGTGGGYYSKHIHHLI